MEGPCNLVIIRHGLSEHNLAKNRGIYLDKRHTSNYKLTDIGKSHAKICGEFVKDNISEYFDKYFTSEYVRAVETAYYLDLPDAEWETNFYLRERDKGTEAGKRSNVKKEFYWSPPGGESMATLCIRVDQFLNFLNENCSGLNVVIVTHGTLMEAFRIRLENMDKKRYEELVRDEKIKNCEILWYTQRNPITKKYTGEKWMTKICPYDIDISEINWNKIQKFTYKNTELRIRFDNINNLIDTNDDEKNMICKDNKGCMYVGIDFV